MASLLRHGQRTDLTPPVLGLAAAHSNGTRLAPLGRRAELLRWTWSVLARPHSSTLSFELLSLRCMLCSTRMASPRFRRRTINVQPQDCAPHGAVTVHKERKLKCMAVGDPLIAARPSPACTASNRRDRCRWGERCPLGLFRKPRFDERARALSPPFSHLRITGRHCSWSRQRCLQQVGQPWWQDGGWRRAGIGCECRPSSGREAAA